MMFRTWYPFDITTSQNIQQPHPVYEYAQIWPFIDYMAGLLAIILDTVANSQPADLLGVRDANFDHEAIISRLVAVYLD